MSPGEGAAGASRRVLMITSRWPPLGTIGVRRAVRLARHLPHFGWTPVVLTDDPDRAPYESAWPLDPTYPTPPVEVHRVPALFPFFRLRRAVETGLARAGLGAASQAFRQLSRAFLLPDHYPEWAPAVARAVRRLGPVDAVWSTGMPFGTFVAAAAAAAVLDRPLVLDYRDPWSQAERPAERLRHRLRMPRAAHAALEAAILRRAAGVSYVNADMLARNRAAFGIPPGACWEVIPNGFDPVEQAGLEPIRGDRPTVLYAGSCYGGRSLLPVLRALADGYGPGADGLVLEFFGELDTAARRFLEEHPLRDRVRLHARIPDAEIRRRMLGAEALLLLIGPEHRTALTGKVFDYIAAGRPILGVGPADSDAASLVTRAGLGAWVDPADRDGLVAALRAAERGDLPFAPDPNAYRQYTAEVMAERTAALLDRVVTR